MAKNGRALVTGGAGFIGSHLVDRLLQVGYQVRVLDDFSSGQHANLAHLRAEKDFRLVRGSVTQPDALREAMTDADVVFHLAAVVSVVKSLAHPRLVERVNVGGTVAVLDEARRRDVKKLVFASSAAVYGDKNTPPVDESCAPAPISPYGATKVSGEAYCSAYSRTYGLATVALRYFNVYGTRRSPRIYSGVMMRFAAVALIGKPPIIYGDGRQTRDFVHVDDVVAATVAAGETRSADGETFNVGTGRQTSILELARLFLSLTGAKNKRIVHAEPRLGDIRRSCANIEKANRTFGYRPSVRLKSGLESFLSWYSGEYLSRKRDSVATG